MTKQPSHSSFSWAARDSETSEANNATSVPAYRQVIETNKERVSQLIRRYPANELSNTTSRSRNIDPDWQRFDYKIIDLPKIIPVPGAHAESLAALQMWEGLVTKVSDGIIYATLIDVTAGDTGPEEFAEIPIDQISSDELHRAVPGAIFQWVIGLKRSPSMVENSSVIYFRRKHPRRKQEEIPALFDD